MKGTVHTLATTIALGIVSIAGCAGDEAANAEMGSYNDNTGYYPEADLAVAHAEDMNRERYDDVGTNPFVVAAHDPFSTFAADVDTASYDIFRRDITDSRLPDPSSVRLEEFVNYFDYRYPAPTAADPHPFIISLDAAPNFLDDTTTLLRVGIQAEAAPAKKPANLVFLIDVSGSMTDANKLPLVKTVLSKTLDVLDPDDTVSIVTYASDTGVRLPPTPVSDKSTILAKIDGLASGGSTAGASGIQLAYEQAERAFLEGGINHVILCTDGDFNVGPSSTTELVSLIEEKRTTGITLTVLGFGYGNLNDAMMEQVSNAGNGIYAVIASESQAERYVEKRMLSTIYHVAKDMKIQVEFNPDQVEAYRLLGYENRAIADDDFRDDAVDGGEVGAGHRVTALYEIVSAGGEIPSPEGAPTIEDGDPVEGDREIAGEEMVRVKVRYKQPGASDEDEASEVFETLVPDDISASAWSLDEDYQWAVSVAAFAEILKGSPFRGNNDLAAIEDVVSAATWLDGDREEFKHLFETAKRFL